MEADGRAAAIAVFEPSDRRRRQLRKELPHAELGTDYVALLEKHQPDVVVISGPDHLHAGQAIQAMEHGAHVLIEKPMATTVKDVKKLLAVEEKAGRKVMVDFTMRYSAPWPAMVREARKGAVGKVYFVQGNYIHDMWHYYNPKGKYRTPWRVDRAHPQNILLGGGCHGLDLMLWTMEDNPVKEVFCWANDLSGCDLPEQDTYLVSILFGDGAIGKLFVSSGCNGAPWGPMLEVYGSDGTLLGGTLMRRDRKPVQLKDSRTYKSEGGHGWPAAVADFLDLVEGKIENPVPSFFGARNVAVCESALRSMKSRRPERVVWFER
jgi:predicted dehydrogenase